MTELAASAPAAAFSGGGSGPVLPHTAGARRARPAPLIARYRATGTAPLEAAGRAAHEAGRIGRRAGR